jgi:hypothetical protein
VVSPQLLVFQQEDILWPLLHVDQQYCQHKQHQLQGLLKSPHSFQKILGCCVALQSQLLYSHYEQQQQHILNTK